MRPTIGRIVHFHAAPGAAPQAAVVVHVHSDDVVNLAVWDSNGNQRSVTSVLVATHALAPTGASWSWPPRT